MLSEIMPFWSKYWYYIAIFFVTYFVVTYFARYTGNEESSSSSSSSLVSDTTRSESTQICDPVEDAEENIHEPALPKSLEHVPYEYNKPTENEIARKAREFYKIADSRRTLRFFSSDAVPKGIIHDLVKTAGTAPSGAHTEPWTFVAISSKVVKARVREIIEREEELNYKKRMGKKWTTDLEPLRTNWIKEYLTIAPWLILVFKQTHGILPDGRKKMHYYHETSVSIACGLLITAIQYAGLVTLASTPLNSGPALRTLLGRPSSEKLCLLLPVGYPASDATVPNLQRKHLQDILIEFE